MWTKIFLFLWIVSTIKQRSTSIQIDCAKRVQRCPVGKEQWSQKNEELQCRTNYGYVCLRDSIGYLYESCMANFTVQANTGDCPVLLCNEKKPHLGTDKTFYRCPEEVPGCPPRDHPDYSIHHIYKYPRCVESSFSVEIENTSTRSTTFISVTTKSTNNITQQESKHVIIVAVISALLLIVAGFIIGYLVSSRKKKHEYAKVTYAENKDTSKEDYDDLRYWIQSVNESEADRIIILPLKEDDTIEVDRIYVPLSIVDEYKIHTSRKNDEQTISELTPDKMFDIATGKPARFIFLLGDAGYGKTVQCRRIAKSWCKTWKTENAQHENDLQVRNFENTKNEKLQSWEKYLKDFEFLFYVPMRAVNYEHVNIRDMIYDYYRRFDFFDEHTDHLDSILYVLKDKRYKCFIILDGLDEWNLSESKREHLQNKGLPNCEGMPNCTFLFTMRSWRLMEVHSICRQGLFTKVLLLHGLDKNGMEELTTNMLCNYFHIERHSDDFLKQSVCIKNKTSLLSKELGSLMKIPLLAVFFILTWHEEIETGPSLTTFYLSMIEALMKRSFKSDQSGPKRSDNTESSVLDVLDDFLYVSTHMPEISRLLKVVFKDHNSQSTTFVLKDEHLKDKTVKETIDLFLRIGLLSKHDASGQIHENNVRVSFLHKTIQEFIYSLHLLYDRSEADIVHFFTDEVTDIEKALEMSTILTFVSGLSPAIGCKISERITEVSSIDEDLKIYRDHFATETYNKVFHLFNLQLRCYREVRGLKSIKDFKESELKYVFSDVILLGNDMDRLTIRESADILRYHHKDIKSLCMKFIPNDGVKGITNIELADFLRNSKSLVALDIDGYDEGKCRLFDDTNIEIPSLQTLGLFNVAFTDNLLTDIFTKGESLNDINALGLFSIKSADDLVLDFQYQFASIHRLHSAKSGYVQKRKLCPSSEISKRQIRRRTNEPLLKHILGVLPLYNGLSTLHVSYMDSEDDRNELLHVLPKIGKLSNFGYVGTFIHPKPDYVYDIAVLRVILRKKELQTIFLDEIILEEDVQDVLNFEILSSLEQITLEVFQMNKFAWCTFVTSLSNIQNLRKVILNDTNIDEESYRTLNSFSVLNVIKDDSTEW